MTKRITELVSTVKTNSRRFWLQEFDPQRINLRDVVVGLLLLFLGLGGLLWATHLKKKELARRLGVEINEVDAVLENYYQNKNAQNRVEAARDAWEQQVRKDAAAMPGGVWNERYRPTTK